MKNTTDKGQGGMTLIELLVVMGLFGIVMVALYSLYAAHQRTAYAGDEVVEVQQNLRIGMDSMIRDVRMAGMLVTSAPDTPARMPPIQLAGNATGALQPLPAPDDINSDEMTLITASASATFARITPLNNASDYSVPASQFSIPVDLPESVDSFNVNDHVRIVRPLDRSEPRLSDEAPSTGRVYRVTGMSRNVPSLTVIIADGYHDPTNISLNKGDMICKTSSPYTNPNTVKYCLGPTAECGSSSTCPNGQLCLMRGVNSAVTDVIAQNMAGLQIRYLLDDGREVEAPAPEEYGKVRAVRATLTGRTVTSNAHTGGQDRKRQIESVIQIRNR